MNNMQQHQQPPLQGMPTHSLQQNMHEVYPSSQPVKQSLLQNENNFPPNPIQLNIVQRLSSIIKSQITVLQATMIIV
jgi:hypothetical protein